jgi:hypothetical protein
MMTMKEACEHVKTSRIANARKHRIEVTKGDLCSGFTDKEYNRLKVKGKGAGSKGRKYSHTKLWGDQNISNRIHTFYHSKWDLQK